MIFKAQLSAAAEVELTSLVHPEQTVDTPLQQLRNHEIRGEIAIPQHDLARLQAIQQRPEEGRLARLLPLVRTERQVANHPGGQRDQRHQSCHRESQSDALGRRLGEDLLVLQRVGHRDGSAVDQRDFASLTERPKLL